MLIASKYTNFRLCKLSCMSYHKDQRTWRLSPCKQHLSKNCFYVNEVWLLLRKCLWPFLPLYCKVYFQCDNTYSIYKVQNLLKCCKMDIFSWKHEHNIQITLLLLLLQTYNFYLSNIKDFFLIHLKNLRCQI